MELFSSSSPPEPGQGMMGRGATAGGERLGLENGDPSGRAGARNFARWSDLSCFATPLDFLLTVIALTGCLATGLFAPPTHSPLEPAHPTTSTCFFPLPPLSSPLSPTGCMISNAACIRRPVAP